MWNLLLLYLRTQNIIYDDLEVIAFYLHFNAKTVIGQDAEKQFTYILYMFCSKHQNQKKKKTRIYKKYWRISLWLLYS